MTVINQMKFICNRCDVDVAHPTANTPPIARISNEGWTTLFINSKDEAAHLCSECSVLFRDFMAMMKVEHNPPPPPPDTDTGGIT